MLKISDITIKKLKNNKLVKELPEFYELKNVIENNEWHKNDSTFNHTISVLKELEKIMKNADNKISVCLNKKVDNYNKKNLLFLSALFHDIAKKDTIVKNENITSFPNHERVGFIKAGKILDRFDISKNEKNIVLGIIKNHGAIHPSICPENKKIKKEFEEFRKKYKDILLELILLTMADTIGCQLAESNPKSFKFRIKFYKNILKKC